MGDPGVVQDIKAVLEMTEEHIALLQRTCAVPEIRMLLELQMRRESMNAITRFVLNS